MPTAHLSVDDVFQILSFYNRPQLFKFLFINRLFLGLLEERFATKPYANAILRIWAENTAEEEKEADVLMPSQCSRLFVGIAILDNHFGNQEMHQKITTNVTKFTRKWQFYLDERDKEIHLNDIEALQDCRRIVQFFQNGRKPMRMEENNRNDADDAYWAYNEEEACFVHKLGSLEDGDEDNNDVEYAKQLHANMIRTQTQMRYIQMREHLIANDFTPTRQCLLSAKFPFLLTNADGAIGAIDELQHFLNGHLNSQRYVRLLSVELPSRSGQPAAAAWRVHKSENNIMQIMPPQISVPNHGQKLPTTISQPNVCNHVYIMSPKSIIVKYEDRSNLNELIESIYQYSSLDCAVQIQLPSAYLVKESSVNVISQTFLHAFLQQFLQDFLLPNCSPRNPFICEILIHKDFNYEILHPVATLNLGEFKSQHQFRRINYDADEEHFISMEDISPAIQRQRLIVDDDWCSAEEDPDYSVDSQFGFAFYDSNTKDYWRLHQTQLSADLCQIKICQFNEERDSAFHKEYNNEVKKAIDRIKRRITLENSFFH